ncbi:amidohydrolase family protein [Permianibacter aggregans]|uniref:Imidazolonepropionase-like amidohydrolase n=1 Tax=Permianibacter aggregans TaxID=1510150 RepID=A0A4R6UJX1_9GAMM|nr:amidohydrolase family protein [Permianibacter aggregans]QGX38912.1 imidazolonepropionase [Permianibacter aggregans]TDQ46842.1 imidazolonepropionase-like amidohydrolase [Permianibacter aggregans]
MKRFTLTALALTLSSVVAADNIFIQNAMVHTIGDKGLLPNANILIRDNKIVAVGSDVKADADSRVINADGRFVTPGLMNAHTGLGTIEIEAIDDTVDIATDNEDFGAHFDVSDAINPNSPLIDYNRMMGLTRAVVTPAVSHGVFGGRSTVIHLGDSELVDLTGVAVVARLGESAPGASEGSRATALMMMREAFEDARDYAQNKSAYLRGDHRDYRLPYRDLEALLPVLNGKVPLVVSVDRASDIRAVLKLAKNFGIRLILVGASEGHLLAKEIADANVLTILAPMENTPGSFDTLYATLENAAKLHAAGVKLAFTSNAGDSPSHNAHLVRQGAGNAVAYGLPAEAALAGLTRNPAEAFGLGERYGQIAVGFDADIVIWSGDPLEVTSYPDHVLIKGKEMPRVSRQTLLRDRYKNNPADPARVYQK